MLSAVPGLSDSLAKLAEAGLGSGFQEPELVVRQAHLLADPLCANMTETS